MAASYYIRTPVDDLEQPHWRCLEAESGGAEAIVFALRLRGLAAKSGCGGLITDHIGGPMLIGQISVYLGYSVPHIQRYLELLHRHRLAEIGDGAGEIRVLDPVIEAHFRLVTPISQAGTKQQPTKRPNQRYSRTLTQAERQHLSRTGQLPQGVYRLDDMSRHTSHLDVTPNVTSTSQHNYITSDCDCHVTDSISSSNSNSSKSVTPPAAVSLPSAEDPIPIPIPEVLVAAEKLPPTVRQNCLVVIQDHLHLSPEVLTSNIQLLAGRLYSPKSKPITNPGGWLKDALGGDYAASQRQAEAQEVKKAIINPDDPPPWADRPDPTPKGSAILASLQTM